MVLRNILGILILLMDFHFTRGFAASVTEINSLVNIDLSSYDPLNETTHNIVEFIYQVDGNLTQVIVKSNENHFSSFYVIQAHSFQYNISLRDTDGNGEGIVTGRNLGLVKYFSDSFIHSFLIETLMDQNNTIVVVVTVYERSAPIPGGCAKENENKFPIIEVVDGSEIIAIKSAPPSVNGLSCNASESEVLVEVYQKYLHSQNFDSFEYHTGIVGMLTVRDVRNNAHLVSRAKGNQELEKLFSSYVGVGEIFTVLVTANGKTSAYVPTVSYGLDINTLIRESKEGISGQGIFVILFSILPIVALVIIYRGHAYFHFTVFSLGLSCGTIIAFFFLNQRAASTVDGTFLMSLVVGVINGLLWVTIWYKFGIPLVSTAFAFLCTGSLVACLIFNLGGADNRYFHNDAIYWSVFSGIVLICWCFLSAFTMPGHIFSCSFLGAYILMITTLNYWLGGNLQYIIINAYRRTFLPNFNKAVLHPPLQFIDILVLEFFILFTVHGFFKQIKNQRGKPPFPPHQSHPFDGERSPLLSGRI